MKVKCPKCNQEYEVENSMQGKSFNCMNGDCTGIIEVSHKKRKDFRKTELLENLESCFGKQIKVFLLLIVAFIVSVIAFFCWIKYENELISARFRASSSGYHYRSAQREVDSAKSDYEYAKRRYESCKSTYASVERTFTLAERKYKACQNAFESARNKAEKAEKQFMLDMSERGYEFAKNAHESAKREYEPVQRKLDAAKRDYESAKYDYESAKSDYESAQRNYESANRKYDAAMSECDAKEKDWKDVESWYENAMPKEKVANVIFIICIVAFFIFILVFWGLHLIFIHRCWQLIPEDRATTTPNKAVWLNFIPGLFPFWQWVTYFELGKAYSDLSGRRGNKVFALIFSIMNWMGVWLLVIPYYAMMLVMQGEFLRSATMIVEQDEA